MAGLPDFFRAVAGPQTMSTSLHRKFWKTHFRIAAADFVLASRLQEEFERAMGQSVFEGYGSTEVVPLTFNRAGAARVGSIGRATDGVRIRLLDEEGGDVPPGEVGEICIQSPWLMTGYWNDPEATAEAIRDGWFHTGDLARCDEDGYYWFAGRTKQIIIRGGSNISPQEVESVLGEHPAVREVAVIGRPDSTWGETVVAFVVLKDGEKLSAEELIQFTRARMATYKTPEHVIFRDALPKNATGKMDRRALRDAERTPPSV